MMQFKTLLVDAYRQLSAAKLFWLTLGLSALVVVLYGSIGFDDQGVTLFYGLWDVESKELNAGSPWARGLYIGIYSSFLVDIWLAWIATVLALITKSLERSLLTLGLESMNKGNTMQWPYPTSKMLLYLM